HVVRLFGPAPTADPDAGVARAGWSLEGPAPKRVWPGWHPQQGGFTRTAYTIRASSPGDWANGLRVKAHYRRNGASRKPEVDLTVRAADEPIEHLIGLDPTRIEAQ